MESTFLVPTAPEVVSISSAPQSPGTIGERSEILRNVLRFSHTRWLDWLHRSFFLQRPPCHQPRQFWSLGKSTGFLGTSAVPNIAPSKDQLFRKVLFLTALTLGTRASQLHALSRHSAWTVFATNDA
ncbi:hypothetical protein Pmani_013189 [Petrolisthes manimaculis]|uniref:Uncharacterized protein n=1 Tax=Petrolisthes manimaculis TaxID=1843537 RepID=A0AAE1PVH5_9EUCA|nr:hypothetical protein Pmani_013189 [Petrolisthes manimaculis]